MQYGDKRDYRKIHIFIASGATWKYAASTTWSKTLKDAKGQFFATHKGIHIDNIKCSFAKD